MLDLRGSNTANGSTTQTSGGGKLIIGGGINGAGIARDAAGRGASVLLLEQGDLAGAILGRRAQRALGARADAAVSAQAVAIAASRAGRGMVTLVGAFIACPFHQRDATAPGWPSARRIASSAP